MASDDYVTILRIGGAAAWQRQGLAQLLSAGRYRLWLLRAEDRAEGEVIEGVLHQPDAPGLPLLERLYRADIPTPDALLIHTAAFLQPALCALKTPSWRPRLIHLADATLSGAAVASAAVELRIAGYRTQQFAGAVLAEIGLPAARDNADWQQAVESCLAQDQPLEALDALTEWRQHMAVPMECENACIEAGLSAYRSLQAAARMAEAERIVALIAELRPHHAALQQVALTCNLALGHAPRAARFARQLLLSAPGHHLAHLALVDGHAARGDHAAEEESRRRLALAPPGSLHPMRQLHDAHRALSLMLRRPRDAAGALHAGQLAAMAQATDAAALPEQNLHHWAAHYRSLIEAAEPGLLAPAAPAAPLQALPLCRADGQSLPWARLRRSAHWRNAKLFFLVAADARYLRLYAPAYLRSVLRHADVAAMVMVHVIGGAAELAGLVAEIGISDPRVFFTADAFNPGAVTTICHDSDGPRALPVAHFQSIRFAVAERLLACTGRPVIISDIDAVLQRGVADLLTRHAGQDVVLNRNTHSESFGSHLTANLLLLMPTRGGHDFARDLRAYLDRALAGAEVSRWIDQCGLQMVWWDHAASSTHFGWFDTQSDINNVIYPSWMPNPFRFLSLYHGFDMASLPEAA